MEKLDLERGNKIAEKIREKQSLLMALKHAIGLDLGFVGAGELVYEVKDKELYKKLRAEADRLYFRSRPGPALRPFTRG